MKPLFYRERQSKTYYVSAYFIGQIFGVLFFDLICPLIIVASTYFVIGFNTEEWWKFPLFCKKFLIIFFII